MRADIQIRRARLTDAATIAELSGQLGYPASEREMVVRLGEVLHRKRDAAAFVAEDVGHKVIGWLHVSATHLLEVPFRAEINGLVVAEEQRSSGTGALLLLAAERWAKTRGCNNMSVRSNVIRDRAHAFYLRNGYEHYKTQKAFRKDL